MNISTEALQKMINKIAELEQRIEKLEKKQVKRFKPPTLEEVTEYFTEKGSTEERAQEFLDHYEVRDWKPKGYTQKMKDWKRAANRWFKAPHWEDQPNKKITSLLN